MIQFWKSWRWDGLGVSLAGLCLVHCLITTIIVALAASISSVLLTPAIHEVGLALAVVIGAVALGKGASVHGRAMPLAVGVIGLLLMAVSLTMQHSGQEIALSILGVAILSISHYLNYRALR